MDDTISRQAALDVLVEFWRIISKRHASYDDELWAYANCKNAIKSLPSAQPDLLDGLKIIEQFLQSCNDSLTCEIIAPNGMKLHTDWGYFVEGLEELRRYAERRTDE